MQVGCGRSLAILLFGLFAVDGVAHAQCGDCAPTHEYGAYSRTYIVTSNNPNLPMNARDGFLAQIVVPAANTWTYAFEAVGSNVALSPRFR